MSFGNRGAFWDFGYRFRVSGMGVLSPGTSAELPAFTGSALFSFLSVAPDTCPNSAILSTLVYLVIYDSEQLSLERLLLSRHTSQRGHIRAENARKSVALSDGTIICPCDIACRRAACFHGECVPRLVRHARHLPTQRVTKGLLGCNHPKFPCFMRDSLPMSLRYCLP